VVTVCQNCPWVESTCRLGWVGLNLVELGRNFPPFGGCVWVVGPNFSFVMGWVELVSHLVRWVGLGQTKWTHGQLCDLLWVYTTIMAVFRITHFVTHLVWPHRPKNSPGRPRAQRISPRGSPSLFPLFLLKHPLNALMLEAPTARRSS